MGAAAGSMMTCVAIMMGWDVGAADKKPSANIVKCRSAQRSASAAVRRAVS
jgi:hypothetical protein